MSSKSSAAAPAIPVAASTLRSLTICTAYCILSAASVFHNKFLLSHYLPHENSVLLVQNIFAISFVVIFGSDFLKHQHASLPSEPASPAGASSNDETTFATAAAQANRGKSSPLMLPIRQLAASMNVHYTIHHSLGDWLIGLCYSLNVLTGVWSLAYLSVPMFSSIKRCNVVVVWIIEFFHSPTSTTRATFAPTFTQIVGQIVLSYHDLEFSGPGYFFGCLSCIFQSVAFEIGKRVANHGKDVWSVLLMNSIVSVAVQLVWMTFAGELKTLMSLVAFLVGGSSYTAADPNVFHIPQFLTYGFSADKSMTTLQSMTPMVLGLHLCFNGFLIMLLNYSVFLNCSINSPLTHVVTGNVRSFLTILFGILIFSVTMSGMGYVGLTIAFTGSAWFSVVKMKHELEKRQKSSTEGSAGREKVSLVVEESASVVVPIGSNATERPEKRRSHSGDVTLELSNGNLPPNKSAQSLERN